MAPSRDDSSRSIARALQARGITVSHATINAHPERVAYDDDGTPIGYTPGEPSRPGGKVGRRWVRLPRWNDTEGDEE